MKTMTMFWALLLIVGSVGIAGEASAQARIGARITVHAGHGGPRVTVQVHGPAIVPPRAILPPRATVILPPHPTVTVRVPLPPRPALPVPLHVIVPAPRIRVPAPPRITVNVRAPRLSRLP